MGKGYGLNSRKDHEAKCYLTKQIVSEAITNKIITRFGYNCPICGCYNDKSLNDPRAFSNKCYNCKTHICFILRLNKKLDEKSQEMEYDYWLEKMRQGEVIDIPDEPKKIVHPNFMWAN